MLYNGSKDTKMKTLEAVNLLPLIITLNLDDNIIIALKEKQQNIGKNSVTPLIP